MATDIAGFSSISERCPPDDLSVAVTTYFDKTCGTVDGCGGVVSSFIGDALMIMWGAPALCINPEIKACVCALAIQRDCCTNPVRGAFDALGEQIQTRVGVNAGECLIGNVGGRARMTYTALGDMVNTTFRVEGQSKTFGTRVLITGPVQSKVENIFVNRYIAPVAVVGKEDATHVFELVGIKPNVALASGAVLDAKEEVQSLSRMSVKSKNSSQGTGGTTAAGISAREGANVTAKYLLDLLIAITGQQTLVCEETEVVFCHEYSMVAQQFADGDPAGCLEDLTALQSKWPSFFSDRDGELVAKHRALCGEHRCDSTLIRAETSANVLRKECEAAIKEDAAGVEYGGRRRGGTCMMRAETK
jgi:class 3 adenylate cyclase